MISKRRLYNQDDQNMELIKVLNEDEEGTELIIPCGASLKDEFGNIYRLEGHYILKCDEMHEFEYVTERRVWTTGHCCGWPDIPKNWQNPTGKTDNKVNSGCGPCKEWFRAAYKCETTPAFLQRCEWLLTEDGNAHLFIRRFNNDNKKKDYICCDSNRESRSNNPIWLLAERYFIYY
jgi:hypothetical protein